MNKLKIISLIISLMVLPISFYLTFWMIGQLNADRLIWFLFWIQVPAIIIINIISKLVED